MLEDNERIKLWIQKFGEEMVSIFYPYPEQRSNCVAELLDNFLYISGSDCVKSTKWLTDNSITHIINCVAFEVMVPIDELSHIEILQLPISDVARDTRLVKGYINLCHDWINECKEMNGRILIVSTTGSSRASVVVLSYLVKYLEGSLKRWALFMRERFPLFYPNKNFWDLLISLEEKAGKHPSSITYEALEMHKETLHYEATIQGV
eukprot:TRINITY_DN1601_c0_g1_i1.p1 TRINITY_DN1601_c0_g1~~TRINITY_DN1601_c0_g1_i1.p1  ORF type:complete len:207 (+),score=26.65 TRINITY_DN1601_c0_g1_i1:443-1063(+)